MKYSIKKIAKDSYIIVDETGKIHHQSNDRSNLFMMKNWFAKIDKEHADREALVQEYLARDKRYVRIQKELAQAAARCYN